MTSREARIRRARSTRDHWFQFVALLLMVPSVYLGNRLAA